MHFYTNNFKTILKFRNNYNLHNIEKFVELHDLWFFGSLTNIKIEVNIKKANWLIA